MLDSLKRIELQDVLLDLWAHDRKTALMVTHDVDEAVFLSDENVVLSPRPGRVRARLPVPLPRPRARAIVTSAEFAHAKARCLDLLFDADPAASAEPAGPR